LDKRLYNDFLSRRSPSREYRIIELPKKKQIHFSNDSSLENIYTHISSPNSQEEILFPLTIVNNKTHKRRHKKRPKSHITYKVYKKKRPYTKTFKTIKTIKYKPSSRVTRRSI
jgi:hypothetical protein